ncbi:uncharacterized protein LOC108740731 [Agrilus planipennis]|uniref:Uncharacterized protein LOC108740731 n=1 Tax=Agrilus planipennis TaxID=224129 RepID=A0A1W4XE03_AGRPL|nr:uncharacterized protein LOC108740731 [Agrilus planipennis]XP_018330676.1 uncharacterized protein LOC108740731 [Agrilus planipennis]XP_018330677.1 uncharacterized protein LOC108740731 [Agrilus planipennis]XP_018330678.1 uncharacterized protein LOC108740731 [Agrilus planipennis]
MMRGDKRKRSGEGRNRGFNTNRSKDDLRDWLKREERTRRDSRTGEEKRRSRGRRSRLPKFDKFDIHGRFSPPDYRKRTPSPDAKVENSRNFGIKRWRSISRERYDFDSQNKFSPPRTSGFDNDTRYLRRSHSREAFDFDNPNKFSPPHFDDRPSYHDRYHNVFDIEKNHGDYVEEEKRYFSREEEQFRERETAFKGRDIVLDDHSHRNNYKISPSHSSEHFINNQEQQRTIDRFPEDSALRNKIEEKSLGKEVDDIPEFNPEVSKLSAKNWLKHLEQVAERNKWQDDEKRFNMSSRLAGFARQWYLSAGKNITKWKDLKNKFMQTFPSEMDYCNHLTEMLKRRKQDNESLVTYFDHKVALLNVCDITGGRAVSCIIAGLSDENLRRKAREEDFTSINTLLEFLRVKEAENDQSQMVTPEKSKRKEETICFRCKKPGHKRKDCPERNVCSYCHTKGHFEAECMMKNEDEAVSRSNNKVMFGALADNPTYPQYFKDVMINGNQVKGYIDFSSETVTIREETASKLGLQYQKMYKVIRSFGSSLVSCVGEFEGIFTVDEVCANVKAYIVPSHIQAIPVILGKNFMKQPHVLISNTPDSILLKQRPGSQQASFFTTTSVQAPSYYY